MEKKPNKLVAFGAMATFLLSSCGSSTSANTPAAEVSTPASPAISYEYPAENQRVIHIVGRMTDANGRFVFPLDILQFCVERDLISETLGQQDYPGGGVSVLPNHAACADGVLRETDFPK